MLHQYNNYEFQTLKMGSEEKKGKGELTYKWGGGGGGRGGFIRHSSFCVCFLLDTISAI